MTYRLTRDWLQTLCVTGLCVAPGISMSQVTGEDGEVPEEITVTDRRVANTRPAGSYAAVATMLRFDPSTEVQSRGLPEGQADVTVRGGLFENTGFRLGAVTVTDPQTGHYAAELPIDPALMSLPEIRTGIDNALGGFNASVATVAYDLPRIQQGGSVLIGAGSDDLHYQYGRFAVLTPQPRDAMLGFQFSAALSEGDGSITNGDHEFERYNAQLQLATETSQSDLIMAYQDKFYGWPGAYTGFASLPETDHTRTLLVFGSHREQIENGWWEASGFYRELDDDYDFDRTTEESGAPGSFDHETLVYGAGFDGLLERGGWDWRFSAQFTADDLVESTDLVNGAFNSRDYFSASVVPELELAAHGSLTTVLRAGLTLEVSNRESTEILPVLGVTFTREDDGGESFLSLDYAASSQVPGYTALNSPPAGLFGGNPGLGRARADELSLSLGRAAGSWQASMTAFYRQDDDLVDWTFASGAPFARQANAVDLDVAGVQLLYNQSFSAVDVVAAYTWLDKDADYGSAAVDASFYALNFARHRATLALRIELPARLELRVDNEYRQQEANPLRASSDEAFLSSAALAWRSAETAGLGVSLSVDNLGGDDFQQFPGTPAVGRQVSLSARYDW